MAKRLALRPHPALRATFSLWEKDSLCRSSLKLGQLSFMTAATVVTHTSALSSARHPSSNSTSRFNTVDADRTQ